MDNIKPAFAIFYKNFKLQKVFLFWIFVICSLNILTAGKLEHNQFLARLIGYLLFSQILIVSFVGIFVIDDKAKQFKAIFKIMGLRNIDYLFGNFAYDACIPVFLLIFIKIPQTVSNLIHGVKIEFVPGELSIYLLFFLSS